MLMNPNWNKTAKASLADFNKAAKDVSLADFIGWLETKDRTKTYDYHNTKGGCCMGQYMAARGIKWNFGDHPGPNTYRATCAKVFGSDSALYIAGQRILCGHIAGQRILCGRFGSKHSFGNALRLAKKFQKENAYA